VPPPNEPAKESIPPPSPPPDSPPKPKRAVVIPEINQEIVIDTSEGMREPFERGMSKLEVAIAAVADRVLHPSENLALRTVSGKCKTDDDGRLVVDFGIERRRPIIAALQRLQSRGARGEGTLLSSVISAITHIKPLPNTRRVVVLAGQFDQCKFGDDYVINEINRVKQGLDLEMRFIGLGVPPEDQALLSKLGERIGAEVAFTRSLEELRKALDYLWISKSRNEHTTLKFRSRHPRISPRHRSTDALETAAKGSNSAQNGSVERTSGTARCR
jgi:hypothetical protein